MSTFTHFTEDGIRPFCGTLYPGEELNAGKHVCTECASALLQRAIMRELDPRAIPNAVNEVEEARYQLGGGRAPWTPTEEASRIGPVTVEVLDEGLPSAKAFAHCECGETLAGPGYRTLKAWRAETLVPHAASHE